MKKNLAIFCVGMLLLVGALLAEHPAGCFQCSDVGGQELCAGGYPSGEYNCKQVWVSSYTLACTTYGGACGM